MKVLLVEDHPALARISCDLLRDVHGHDVAYAPDGKSALTIAAPFAPDIVLIDLNLPDMDGYQLAMRLRADPRLARAVLVALTGFGCALNPNDAAAAGIDALYRKPMDFGILPTLTRDRPR